LIQRWELETPFPFQPSNNTIVHQVLRLEAAYFFVTGADEADDVAHAVDAWIDFSLVDADDALSVGSAWGQVWS
jgi:hypothetical protein